MELLSDPEITRIIIEGGPNGAAIEIQPPLTDDEIANLGDTDVDISMLEQIEADDEQPARSELRLPRLDGETEDQARARRREVGLKLADFLLASRFKPVTFHRGDVMVTSLVVNSHRTGVLATNPS